MAQMWQKKTVILLLLFSSKLAAAQTEHHLGMTVGGKVIGTIYTLQHNRWNLTAAGGWLTKFYGEHVSITGGYRLLNSRRKVVKFDAGLGLFGQRYTALTPEQEQQAKEMHYDIPWGGLLATKLHVTISENWNCGVHVNLPFTANKENAFGGSAFEQLSFYLIQLSLQYKLGSRVR
jgi:hypothetical protein